MAVTMVCVYACGSRRERWYYTFERINWTCEEISIYRQEDEDGDNGYGPPGHEATVESTSPGTLCVNYELDPLGNRTW